MATRLARAGSDDSLSGRPFLAESIVTKRSLVRYKADFVSQTGVLLWIVALFALEVQHLKWIAWEYWDCRRHGVKNKECRCKARLMLLL
jgi:hypothetical protein